MKPDFSRVKNSGKRIAIIRVQIQVAAALSDSNRCSNYKKEFIQICNRP